MMYLLFCLFLRNLIKKYIYVEITRLRIIALMIDIEIIKSLLNGIIKVVANQVQYDGIFSVKILQGLGSLLVIIKLLFSDNSLQSSWSLIMIGTTSVKKRYSNMNVTEQNIKSVFFKSFPIFCVYINLLMNVMKLIVFLMI